MKVYIMSMSLHALSLLVCSHPYGLVFNACGVCVCGWVGGWVSGCVCVRGCGCGVCVRACVIVWCFNTCVCVLCVCVCDGEMKGGKIDPSTFLG